ncbi:MAG: MarR family winged helix-turn-helix transcriptional regulator [Candidatus Merdisoma sp.]|jgi:DNA-binding MarR family transcriptional regulator
MSYEELAKAFCEMNFMQSRKRLDAMKTLSAGGEDGALLCIYNFGGRILAGEIAKVMGLTPGRTTNIINMLEKRHYISREHDRADRRKVYIVLTEEGSAYITRRYENSLKMYCGLFERLGEHDSEEYFRILKRLHEIADEIWEEYGL